jgi:hypothetical protein
MGLHRKGIVARRARLRARAIALLVCTAALAPPLAGTENRIAVERRRYNETVREYNVAVQSVPTNIVAAVTGFAKRDVYFEATEGAAEAPKVQF